MDTKDPRAGSTGASISIAADTEASTRNHQIPQPAQRPFAVIIARDLWRRCVVFVEPPTCSRQPRSFPDHVAAMAFAEELARLEGWALIDRTGEGEQ